MISSTAKAKRHADPLALEARKTKVSNTPATALQNEMNKKTKKKQKKLGLS